MKIKIFIAFLSLISFSGFSQAVIDNCSGTPNLLTVGSSCSTTNYTVSSTFTLDGSSSICSATNYRDGWYRFTTPAGATSITIDGTSNRIMGLAVYTSCGGTLVGCNFPGTANASLTVAVSPSTTYYLMISRTNNANSNDMTGTICVYTSASAPSNDACSGATSLPCGTSNLAGTTVGSVSETAPSGCASGYGVWYTFTGNGQLTTISSTAASGFDHEIDVFSGSCASLTNLSCTDAAFTGGTETYNFTSVNGTTYYVYVAYWSTSGTSTNTGSFTISNTCTAPLTNDNCSGAISLGTVSTSTTVVGTNASATADGSYSGCHSPTDNVWYSFTVPSNGGTYSITVTPGTLTYPTISLDQGTCGSQTEISCVFYNTSTGPTSLTASCLSAGTYYIAVDDDIGSEGTFSLSVVQTTPGCSGFPTAGAAVVNTTSSCSGQAVALTLSGASTACGVTYQLQSSTDGSTWTNVAGATSTTYTANPTVSTYYHWIVSCGGNNSTSTSVQVIIDNTCLLMSTQTVTISSCPTTYNFYDSGGSSGSYSNSESYTLTVKAPVGSCITLNFSSFTTESVTYDYLSIYDGATTGATLIGTYGGSTSPPSITSTGTAVTFYFHSDGSSVYSGWAATLSCLNSCSGTPTAGTAAASSVCSALSVSLSGATTGCGISYQWQSSTNSGSTWTNVTGATSTLYTVATPTVNTCYRCNVTCSGNTATSNSVCSSSATGYTCNLNYSAATTTFSMEPSGNLTNSVTIADDHLSNSIPIGFTFCFDSYMYTQFYVASNAAMVFDEVSTCAPNVYQSRIPAANGASTGYVIGQAIPTTTDYVPQNAILAPWHDIDPGKGGTITYATLGTSPNRRCVLSFNNVRQFSSNSTCTVTAMNYTGQIKIYETSNLIEIHVQQENHCDAWNGGYAILGLHNGFGNFAVVPTGGYNYNNTYSINNTAWKFTNGCTSCNAILPVNMLSFDVRVKDENYNEIKFVTSKEVNVKQFHIERSIDGKHFDLVSLVNPKGINGATYINTDAMPTQETYYYRVVTEDKNGEMQYTGIRVAQRGKIEKTAVLRVYPNPFENGFSIEIESAGTNNATIEVIDALGRRVYFDNKQMIDGTNSFGINLPSTSKGLLLLKITDENGQVLYQTKLVQQ